MQFTALVPVKAPATAKGRLAALLSPAERAELARVTFRTVAGALSGASVPLVVLTPGARQTADVTGGLGAVLEESPEALGFSGQLQAALDGSRFDGSDAVLIIHADLPLATIGAVRRLLAAARRDLTEVTMVESADGGTNAMVLPLPRAFALHYGRQSFAAHSEAARAAGLAVHAHRSPELALDLDTADDVRALLATTAGRQSAAGRLLLEMGVESRLAGIS